MQSVFPTSLQNVDPSLTQLQISQRLARDLQHFAFLWHFYLPLNLSPQFIYYHIHQIGKFDYIIYLNIEYITQFNILSYRFVSCAWNIVQCEYIYIYIYIMGNSETKLEAAFRMFYIMYFFTSHTTIGMSSNETKSSRFKKKWP